MKIYLAVSLIMFFFCFCEKVAVPKGTPRCIEKKISSIAKGEVWNPPAKVYSFEYEGATVFYFTPRCCDIPSDLYDEDCHLICHPDGGFTGRGDGECQDLPDKNEWKLIWEDTRKK